MTKDCNLDVVQDIIESLEPLEKPPVKLIDKRTGAKYVQCHIKGKKIIEFGTTDVPLDPSKQAEYRANRNVVVNDKAFNRMKVDAQKSRSFSDIVCEFNKEFEPSKPLKIIGGQHRFEAIKLALESGVDELHGVKIYYELDKTQRLDVQLISNTNIAVSPDLYDRMTETHRGPDLRDFCQKTGLLPENTDFTDKRVRGGAISVQIAKTFILNFYEGQNVDSEIFYKVETTPLIATKGKDDPDWETFLVDNPKFWEDENLQKAAKEFAKLTSSQRSYFSEEKGIPVDFKEKAANLPLLAAWAYIAGVLQKNSTRLERHYALTENSKKDPLNAAALSQARHKTDGPNYRGLGVRTNSKECGRFAELFFSQAEYGTGIDKKRVDVALKKHHAKIAILDVEEAEKK